MPTKTAERQKEVSFSTSIRSYRLVIDPKDVIKGERGQVIKQIPGHAIEFDETTGLYSTSDPDEIEFLRNHGDNGLKFVEVAGEEEPSVSEQMEALGQAGATRNATLLRETIELEESTHNRESVLQAGRAIAAALAPPEEPEGDGESEPSTSDR